MGEIMDAMDAGWEELRREARKIEGDLDVKLSSYAKLGGRLAHGGYADAGSSTDVIAGDRSWKSMEMEIQSLAAATPTTSVTQKLARHRDILHEFTQIEDVISQAQATKGVLSSQRTMFAEIQGKVKHLSDRFPVIRGLLGAIKRKRSKDTIILSAVIAGCTLFLIVYWMSK